MYELLESYGPGECRRDTTLTGPVGQGGWRTWLSFDRTRVPEVWNLLKAKGYRETEVACGGSVESAAYIMPYMKRYDTLEHALEAGVREYEEACKDPYFPDRDWTVLTADLLGPEGEKVLLSIPMFFSIVWLPNDQRAHLAWETKHLDAPVFKELLELLGLVESKS